MRGPLKVNLILPWHKSRESEKLHQPHIINLSVTVTCLLLSKGTFLRSGHKTINNLLAPHLIAHTSKPAFSLGCKHLDWLFHSFPFHPFALLILNSFPFS